MACGPRTGPSCSRRCFNGAMAVRPWMVAPAVGGTLGFKLQWGHGREAMDGRTATSPVRQR